MRELVVAVWQTGAASVISLGLGLVATKIFAVVLGPAGIGFISLVRQTYQSAVVFATLNGQTALAQGIASREGETREQYITTAFWILLATGGVVALAFLALPSQISAVVMGRVVGSAVGVMRWLAFAVVGGVVSTYLAGVFNGHRDIPRLALLQTAGAVVSTLLAYPVALLVKAGDTAALVVRNPSPRCRVCHRHGLRVRPDVATAVEARFQGIRGEGVPGFVGRVVAERLSCRGNPPCGAFPCRASLRTARRRYL